MKQSLDKLSPETKEVLAAESQDKL